MAEKRGAVSGGPVSINPDDMVAGGLPDDFDGEITEVRYMPWDYDGHSDKHVLAARVTIKADEESGLGEVVQHYSAGDLQAFAPSVDGKTPVDLEGDDPAAMEGPFIVRVGKAEKLNNNTNWAHFITMAIEAKFPQESLKGDARCFEGTYGHFNRISQKKRPGLVNPATEPGREKTILVLTEVKAKPTGAGKSAAKSKPAATAATKTEAAPSTGDNGQGEIDTKLVEAILAAVSEADGNTISKAKLPGIAVKTFSGPEKAKALKRVGEPAFLTVLAESGVIWNADTNALGLG